MDIFWRCPLSHTVKCFSPFIWTSGHCIYSKAKFDSYFAQCVGPILHVFGLLPSCQIVQLSCLPCVDLCMSLTPIYWTRRGAACSRSWLPVSVPFCSPSPWTQTPSTPQYGLWTPPLRPHPFPLAPPLNSSMFNPIRMVSFY